MFVKPPGWRAAELGASIPAPEVDRVSYRKFDTPLTRRRAAYVFVHFAVILTASAALLYTQARLPFPVLLAGAGFVLLSLVALTALIESRPWAPALEAARLLVALVAAVTFPWL